VIVTLAEVPTRYGERMVSRRAAALVPRVLLAGGLTGCLLAAGGCQRPVPVDGAVPVDGNDLSAAERPTWQPVSLPASANGGARPAAREIIWCDQRWYVVGAAVTADGATRPAAWTSDDGVRWRSVRLAPESHYGRQSVLDAGACRDGRLAAVGAKTGGVHGNPRTSSWRQLDDGTLAEVTAGFELYGGPAAVNVGRMTAGPAGWLIVGNRISGAAAWTSPDSAAFAIVEAAPELSSDERGRTWAFDALATADGWLIAGALTRDGRIDRDPMTWWSAHGRTWRRQPISGGPDNEELQRLTMTGSAPLAAGLRGATFGAWRHDGERWHAAGSFGSTDGPGVPLVRSLAAAGDRVVAVTTTGATHELWSSADAGRSWRPVVAPDDLPSGAERVTTVATGGDRILLLVDDGEQVGLWAWRL